MDPHDSNHRRNQSIPLQDLNHSNHDSDGSSDSANSHRRTLSDRGRSLLGQRNSNTRSQRWSGRYAPIVETSPSARDRVPLDTSGYGARSRGEDGEMSPLDDMSGFQAAIGFAGLSFQGETTPRPSAMSDNRSMQLSLRTMDSTPTPYEGDQEPEDYFSPTYTDTARLTDSHHLQPISGAGPTTPVAGRSSFQSVHFLTPEGAPPGSRLGDDLAITEAGLGVDGAGGRPRLGSRQRSLSPSAAESPLRRAGTIMRNMSQRVVNISNEPEVVERSIRRKSSLKQARLEGPPSLPALAHSAHDGATSVPDTPPEKAQAPIKSVEILPHRREKPPNPLRGRSLGIFPPDSAIRMKLCDILTHPATEPCILLLIVVHTILLVIDSAPDIFDDPYNSRNEFSGQATKRFTRVDIALLVLFIIYTIELGARIIVSGFFANAPEYSTLAHYPGSLLEKARAFFTLQRQRSMRQHDPSFTPEQPSILRAFTTPNLDSSHLGDSREQQRFRLARRAFLRHSFNRLDFLAVVSFWISFTMEVVGFQMDHRIYLFRMLSCLRILRLLSLTSGTSIILRSLKKSAPLLVNVAFLIGFFWLLFAIIGVQTFKASLRRQCQYIQDLNNVTNLTSPGGNNQYCGGYLHIANNSAVPWLKADLQTWGTDEPKGYICPNRSVCVEGDNPFNGTVSFDNIVQSIEQVFIMMTTNTFSDIMYDLTYAEYLAAALYYALGIVIMAFWLINLLIAVITSSFQVIRDESKTSAFTAEPQEAQVLEDGDQTPIRRRANSLKRLFKKTHWFWITVIIYGLICQSLRSATMSSWRENFIDGSETIVTLALLAEIIIRLTVDWRGFFKKPHNLMDLFLALITTIIQLPPIRNSGRAYDWLTFFQILRAYRVVLAIPITRDLILTVFKNVSGLVNLVVFVFLLTFLAALFAAQMFRGEIPRYDSEGNRVEVTFATIFNSFLGMYQILSSENWTAILYNVTAYDIANGTAWYGATFLIIWYILANFIVLNMFIAVIQESFDISEDEKRLEQVKAFLRRKDLGSSAQGNLSLSTIFKLGQAMGHHRDPLDFGTAATEMLLKDAVVKDFLDEQGDTAPSPPPQDSEQHLPRRESAGPFGFVVAYWQRAVSRITRHEPNPFYSRLEFSRAYQDLDPRQMAKEVVSATERRKIAQREYLKKHPNYNVSLYIFKPTNPIRRMCQRIVGPGRGDKRIDGVEPSIPIWYAFSAFIYAAIVAMVILAAITTPLYQKNYFNDQKKKFGPDYHSVMTWYLFTDLGFAVLFSVEALIKVVADGVFWTPNAYFRSSWGFIDGVVLTTLWIDVGASLANEGQVSRAVGAFKALRALRLLNVSDSARDHFHSVVVRGGWKVISAALVSLSLLIPFALYGLNLFNGRMLHCTDSTNPLIVNLTDCTGEYMSSPFTWNVLAPRQVTNSYFSFDNFGDSLFILFQIVSQEGWIDVMWAAESITGKFLQPQPFTSQGNALFFVIFNLLGAVFVLTLFVSVFMRNYTEQTGVAFLTTEQRSWLELRKHLRQVAPSKRPAHDTVRKTWESYCYRLAVRKNGPWQRFVTGILILHLILLCLEFYPSVTWWDHTRDAILFLFTLIYMANIVIRVVGLTWSRFRRSSWDMYAVVVVFGTFVTTLLLFSNFGNRTYVQLHKIGLVLIALLLIPRNNQLDQLFKTAAASFAAIANLLATWFVLFLAYAIALTQTFGLTKFNQNESNNVNFRTVPKALVVLFRISVGEGWNQLMTDFGNMEPPYCTVTDDSGDGSLGGDCGSTEWARALFISWNIISMYIFVNLFVSLIYESFSYVYQRSSGLSIISREEIRRFKEAWAVHDKDGKGYISKEEFPRLLGELSGVFEMRIYDGDFTVGSLIADCSVSQRASELPVEGPKAPVEIDLKKLNRRLAELPVREIRQRRWRMNRFYEEVLVSADPDRGIRFNDLLMILAHYKVINDNKSLRLEEFLRRRARLQRVEEAVRRNIVVGFFDTLYWTRRFKRAQDVKKSGRMTFIPQFTVPEIFVDDEDITNARGADDPFQPSPILSPLDTEPMHTSGSDARSISPPAEMNLRSRSNSIQPDMSLRSRANSIQHTPTHSPTNSINPGLSPFGPHLSVDGAGEQQHPASLSISRPPSPLEPGGPSDAAARSRANSNVSAQDVLAVLDESAWGESIRRSFTLRRSQRRP